MYTVIKYLVRGLAEATNSIRKTFLNYRNQLNAVRLKKRVKEMRDDEMK